MLLSPRKNSLDSLFKEVRVSKVLAPKEMFKICDPSDHLQESLGPKSPKNALKRVFLGVGEKVPKKWKIPEKSPILGIFPLFRVFSGTFSQTPKKTLFGILGPEGLEIPVNGSSGRNSKSQKYPSTKCPSARLENV